jgi:hypothetical protein
MTFPIKTEAIDAQESKLILTTIAKADWNQMDPDLRIAPVSLFYRLGLTAKDGWTPPQFERGKNYGEQVQAAAKEWLKKNADTYRVQRYAPVKTPKTETKTR